MAQSVTSGGRRQRVESGSSGRERGGRGGRAKVDRQQLEHRTARP